MMSRSVGLLSTMSCVLMLLLFMSHLYTTDCKSNKYTEDLNVKMKTNLELENEVRPFRMNKTNLIWNKARQKLHGKKLKEAYEELQQHDKREAELKKMKAGGLDKAGAMAEKVLQSYQRLMTMYELENNVNVKRRNEIDDSDELEMTNFDDPKLQSMWLRARDAGFTGNDLRMLKQEFEHQQMKIEEYNFIHGEDQNDVPSDNEVLERKDKNEEVLKPDKKERRQDIHTGYMRLEGLASSLSPVGGHFKDRRVNVMWELAKKTDWTPEQLDNFKEELSHLDHKMEKQGHYDEKVKDSLKKFNNDPEDLPDHHKHVYNTANHLNKRVSKIHGELKNRLDRALRHEEL